MKDFIFAIFTSMLISFIAAATRGNGENVLKKTIIGTVFGTIFMLILMHFRLFKSY